MLNVKANPIYTKPIKYSPSTISQIPNPTSNKDNTIEIFDNSFKYFINYDLFLFVTSCSTFKSGLTIPANETFILGESNLEPPNTVLQGHPLFYS